MHLDSAEDGDSNQLIYPAKNGASRTTVPVRGPDSLGHGKFWRSHGMPNEDMKVILEVVRSLVGVTAADAAAAAMSHWVNLAHCPVRSRDM